MKYKISIPGSKSYTNRALFIAAMCGSKVKIKNALISDDTKAMMECLKILKTKRTLYNLNARLSGTTIRFILALSCLTPGEKIIYGEESLNKRPIEDLVSGLTQLGAKIEYVEKKGYPPIKVLSSKLNPGTVKIKGSISSQYISALLMIAPLVGTVTIQVTGDQISKPYIDMAIDTMEKFGVKVINQNYKKYIVPGNQKYQAKQYLVEGDFSSAGYFFAIAALTKLTITLKNLNPYSKQADIKFLKILEDMGNKIKKGKNQITIFGKGIKPINVNMQDFPDSVQTLSVLCAFAKGVSKITGVKSLRIKETERVRALQKELAKMGIKTLSTKDSLTIFGGNPHGARIDTYNDHRMAMAFAVASCKIPDVIIQNPGVVSKTFPSFWKELKKINKIQSL
ncbi:MAG: 3-phosphoshikimate 1-carboxyvinyltransferase [Candidatus Daviesbacteria bacterium]|nr:3-phosphoshikimate 1-carboxyvinyltransferase [Candidatus Daviesbacteria bacterium]